MTVWVHWFVGAFVCAQSDAKEQVRFVLRKSRIIQCFESGVNERKLQVFRRMFGMILANDAGFQRAFVGTSSLAVRMDRAFIGFAPFAGFQIDPAATGDARIPSAQSSSGCAFPPWVKPMAEMPDEAIPLRNRLLIGQKACFARKLQHRAKRLKIRESACAEPTGPPRR